MITPLSPSTLYSSLATISPQDYPPLPKSPSELGPFLTITIEAAHNAVSSIPAHPAVTNVAPENHDIKKLYKSVKLPATPPPPGDMKLWKLPAKDGKGAWFARRSVHESIGFERFRQGLDIEFALGENELEGMERQEVPGGGVDSVRGIGCVERVGEKVVEGDGEMGGMEIFRLAAQFPGPTAAREFVVVCCKKQGREKEGGGRWYMIVSRPVKAGEEIEGICPGKEGEGYIRGEYESVELIREVVPEGEEEGLAEQSEVAGNLADERENVNGDEIVEEADVSGGEGKEEWKQDQRGNHGKHHRCHQTEGDIAPGNLSVTEPQGTPTTHESVFSSKLGEARNYPIEWVMLSRSDPGGNVPRWIVERGTPGSIVKDATNFLKWLAGLSDEQLGLNSPCGRGETLGREQIIAVSPNGDVMKGEGVQIPQHEERGSENPVSNAFGIANEMVNSIAPTCIIPNIPSILGGAGGTHANTESATPQQHPSPPARLSTDALSLQSFSTAAQQPTTLHSPPHTPSSASAEPPLTPSTTDMSITSTTAAPAPPPASDTESKPLSRLLSQKTRLLARLEKALQKTHKSEDAETKLRQRYEEELKREEERYKRDMEKLELRKEREAQKQKEKEQKQLGKGQKRKVKKEKEKIGVSSSNTNQTVREAREVVERLTRENERLARENEGLRKRVSVLQTETGCS